MEENIPEQEKKSSNPLRQIDWGESYTSLLLGLLIVIVGAFLVVTVLRNMNTSAQPRQEVSSDRTVAKASQVQQPTTPAGSTKIRLGAKIESTPTSIPTKPTIVQTNPVPTSQINTPKTYTVISGDNLWTISQKIYSSGFNWVDIVRENNLPNPDKIYVGQVLQIPQVATQVIAQGGGTKGGIIESTPQVSSQSGGPIIPQGVMKPSITGNSYSVVKGDSLWSIAVRAYGNGHKWTEIAKANNLQNPRRIHSGNQLVIPR